ncbi:MAG TPA: 4-hydroxy-tetrahydrodipicolinate synthase [Gemmatales bacterium]|nr:4-hydroxy-tetrahydrodipicolinate synthase [Gemmatales bacterium]
MKLHGIIPPVATPLTLAEEPDLPRLRWFIDHLLAGGIHAVFVLGTNSEFYAFPESEKQQVMATAVAHVAGRVPVLVGTGAETTREAIRLTRLAEREGADAVSVITPYFIQPSQAELIEHYRRIADSTRLPVVIYSNPAHTGVRIAPETVERLAELPQIVAIKDSSGDLQTTIDYLRLSGGRLGVFQGRDTLILPSLLMGAVGAVAASANVAPRLCADLYAAWERGDWPAAKAAQQRLHPVRQCLALATPPAGVKAALRLLGIDLGPSAAPLAEPPPANLELMRASLTAAGLAPADR